jgi:hypothetical protein
MSRHQTRPAPAALPPEETAKFLMETSATYARMTRRLDGAQPQCEREYNQGVANGLWMGARRVLRDAGRSEQTVHELCGDLPFPRPALAEVTTKEAL